MGSLVWSHDPNTDSDCMPESGLMRLHLYAMSGPSFRLNKEKIMATWLEDIITSLDRLGGVAEYERIYTAVREVRRERLPGSWHQIIKESSKIIHRIQQGIRTEVMTSMQ